jgi:hypothetical protein
MGPFPEPDKIPQPEQEELQEEEPDFGAVFNGRKA